MDPSSKKSALGNGPAPCSGSKDSASWKIRKPKKKTSSGSTNNARGSRHGIFNNLLLSQGKVHLAKMIRFPKMGPLIFTLCFLTLAGRSKKQRERRAHFRVLEK